MLFVFGVGDNFFADSSQKQIKRSTEIIESVDRLLASNEFFGVVRVNELKDTFAEVNPFSAVKPTTRLIDFKLCTDSMFDKYNQIVITGSDKTETVLDGNQLDYVLPADEYNIYIAGIDINGIFVEFIKQFEKLGYSINVFSDIIKPFNKQTIQAIKDSKARFRKS